MENIDDKNKIVPKIISLENVKRVRLFFVNFIKSLMKLPYFLRIKSQSQLIFNLGTVNQKLAVEPLLYKMKNENIKFELFSDQIDLFSEYTENLNDTVHKCPFTLIGIIFYSRKILIDYTQHPEKRDVYRVNLLNIFMYCGMYICYRRLFAKSSILCAVFSNDHNPNYRAFFLAANNFSVTTIYIPHASVSFHFPPLESSVAFLEGNDMLNKYKACGINGTKIILSGSMKMDEIRQSKKKQLSSLKVIGVAYNLLDSPGKVLQLVKNILDSPKLNVDIVLRPHPRDKSNIEYSSLKLTVSDSATETSIDFLNKVDILISGSSNIILESLLSLTPCLQYNFSETGKCNDNYGFLVNGLLLKVFSDFESILDVLVENDVDKYIDYRKLNHYDALFASAEQSKKSLDIVYEYIFKELLNR